jgi:hypothetical protein
MTAYGATVKGILDYVPELRLDPVDKAETVETFIPLPAMLVEGALGPRLRALRALNNAEATAVANEAENGARALVELGAASLLQDSRYPELADASSTSQRYGAALWARFEVAGDTLDTELERLGTTVDAGVGADLPEVSAPAPFFHDRHRW